MPTVTPVAATAPAPPPPGRGAPEASAAPFAAVLDDHKARTAVAEGQTPKRPTGAQDKATTTPSTPDARDAAQDATSSATSQNAEGPQVDPTPQPTLPVLIVDQASAAPAPVFVTVPPAAAPAASPVPAAAPPDSAAPADATATAALQAGVPGADVALPAGMRLPGAAQATPVADTSADAARAGGSAAADVADGAVALPADVAGAGGPTAPAADPASAADTPVPAHAVDEHGRRGDDAGTRSGAPRTMTPAAAEALRAAAPAAATPDAGAAASATGLAPAPTTTATATVSAPAAPAPSAAVPLQQAVETVRLTLGASAQRGVTRARIALRPEELGGVEVHLKHTAEGLSARVVAEAPEAAHLLSQAAAELRRTLEQQGLNLVRIDVATAGDDAPGTGAGAAGNEHRDGRRHAGGRPGDIAASDPDQTIAERTIELPNGALVDVLA
jgi:Flagellar hook-length control protein FliK